MKFLEVLWNYLRSKPSNEVMCIKIFPDATVTVSLIDGMNNATEHHSLDDLDELLTLAARMKKKLEM